MAKSKKTEIKSQVRRAEFIVGASTLIITIALLSLFFEGKNVLSFFKSQNQSIKVVDTHIGKEVSPSIAPGVSKLSYTDSGEKYALVKKGDSYFRITKRFCGTGRNYMSV